MKTVLSNPEFWALYESELFTAKKFDLWKITNDSRVKLALFQLHKFLASEFFMKARLRQREIWTIRVIFQALSIGNLKNIEKGVQQGQKLRILLNSIKLLWGTTATSMRDILKSTDI